MRAPLILICLLFPILFMYGQNYQIAKSNRTILYENPQIFAIKIDSVKVIEGNSILYVIPNNISLLL